MKDGGQAFPVANDGGFIPGMSMRQYYKGMVAGHLFSSKDCHESVKRKAAGQSIDVGKTISILIGMYADLMIAEDEKHEKESK